MNQGQPVAVALAYLKVRLTYRVLDLAGYRSAVIAPAFTTPAFALRSVPTETETYRLEQAQETSTVRVGEATPADEAPATPTTAYVTVTCLVTTTYRGGSDTAAADWTLRLVLAGGQWRVDGVLSAG